MIACEAHKTCDQCGKLSRAVVRLNAHITATTACLPCLLDAAIDLAVFRGDKLKIKHTLSRDPMANDEPAGG